MSENIDDQPARKRGHTKIALQLVAIAFFAFLIVYFMRKYAADISSLKHLSISDILLISAWSFVSYSAYAYAVYVVLVDVGFKGLSPFGWLRVYFASRLVNFFVVQGGNIFRLVLLKKNYGFSYTNSIGVTTFLIWINALVALLAGIYFLSETGPHTRIFGLTLVEWTVIATLVLLAGPILVAWAIQAFRDSAFWRSNFLVPFMKIAEFYIESLKKPGLLGQITILSAVHFFFFVGVNYFSFRAIGQTVEISAVCLYTTAFVFTRYINVVPGNLGVSELVGGLVSEQLGTGFGNGLIVAGIVRVVEFIMILLVGLLYGNRLVFDRIASRKIR